MIETQKVFDKYWFEKHQKTLLRLANSWLGNIVFRFKKRGHYLDKTKKISKITPNSIAQFNRLIETERGTEEEYTEHFFGPNVYARQLYLILLPIWWTMHVWDWFADPFLAPQWSFGFSSLTVNPAAGTGGASVDGSIRRGSVDENWATIIAGAGNDARPSETTGDVINISSNNTADKYGALVRAIYTFDTSALGSSASISAAVLSIFGTGKSNGGSYSPNIDIYTSTPASSNNLVNGDYSQIGSTSQTGSAMTYANWSASAYNDFTFNGTGIGNISLTGVSKFGARNANYDVAAVAPTWVSFAIAKLSGEWADNGGNLPKLVITYSIVTTTSTTTTTTTTSSSTSSTTTTTTTSSSTTTTSSSTTHTTSSSTTTTTTSSSTTSTTTTSTTSTTTTTSSSTTITTSSSTTTTTTSSSTSSTTTTTTTTTSSSTSSTTSSSTTTTTSTTTTSSSTSSTTSSTTTHTTSSSTTITTTTSSSTSSSTTSTTSTSSSTSSSTSTTVSTSSTITVTSGLTFAKRTEKITTVKTH